MKNIMKKKKFMALGISLVVILSSFIGIFGFKKTYAANIGQQLTSPEAGWRRYEDNDTKISYSGKGWYKNDWFDTITPTLTDASIKFSFYGTKLRILGYCWNNRISHHILIDNVDYGTYFNNLGTSPNTLIFEKTGLKLQLHTVIITPTSTVNNGGVFGIDSIDIDSDGELRVNTPVINVSSITLDKNTVSLNVGQTNTLTATIAPENATNKNVTWTSSNNSIATVDETGKITGGAIGKATITATTEDGGKTAQCEVTVTQPVTGIMLNKNTVSLNDGQSDTLVATVMPEDASNKEVTWTSSDNSICTVDKTGKITAIKVGTATITVTTADGSKTATCQVTVKDSSDSSSRALLNIIMSNGERKEFDLSADEVKKFVDWYNGNTSPSYAITKNYNVKPFNSRTEYVAHDKVSSFEVNEYTEVQK